jgi:hypothetical protein
VVERLANDPGKLRGMSLAFLENEKRLISSNWAIKSTDWLLT